MPWISFHSAFRFTQKSLNADHFFLNISTWYSPYLFSRNSSCSVVAYFGDMVDILFYVWGFSCSVGGVGYNLPLIYAFCLLFLYSFKAIKVSTPLYVTLCLPLCLQSSHLPHYYITSWPFGIYFMLLCWYILHFDCLYGHHKAVRDQFREWFRVQ